MKMMPDEEVFKLADVHGWLTDREGRLLYVLAREAEDIIVEIGSWKGRSTIFLGCGSKDGNKVPVYAIDHHTGSAEHREMYGDSINTSFEFMNNIENAGLKEIVRPLMGNSDIFTGLFSKNSVDLLFLDGSHEYEYVSCDFKMYFPKVKQRGIVAFHDCQYDGPKRVIKENVDLFSELGQVDGLMITRKK